MCSGIIAVGVCNYLLNSQSKEPTMAPSYLFAILIMCNHLDTDQSCIIIFHKDLNFVPFSLLLIIYLTLCLCKPRPRDCSRAGILLLEGQRFPLEIKKDGLLVDSNERPLILLQSRTAWLITRAILNWIRWKICLLVLKVLDLMLQTSAQSHLSVF